MISNAIPCRPLPEVVIPVITAGTITAVDLLKLRREVFTKGVVDRGDAELLFYLSRRCRRNDPVWNNFFVDALTDWFVWTREPRGEVTEEDGRLLIDGVARDGRIDGSDLELLINVIHWTRRCPEELVRRALAPVKDRVLGGDAVLFGAAQRRVGAGALGAAQRRVGAGALNRATVELVRKMLWTDGGRGALAMTRAKADALFDLHRATADKNNAEEWAELFVAAIASHLMFPKGEPDSPREDGADTRDLWLKNRREIARLLAGGPHAMRGGKIGETFTAFDLFGIRARREHALRQRRDSEHRHLKRAIEAPEAAWLLTRLGPVDVLHGTERALLAFIAAHSPQVHPSLWPLLRRARV